MSGGGELKYFYLLPDIFLVTSAHVLYQSGCIDFNARGQN